MVTFWIIAVYAVMYTALLAVLCLVLKATYKTGKIITKNWGHKTVKEIIDSNEDSFLVGVLFAVVVMFIMVVGVSVALTIISAHEAAEATIPDLIEYHRGHAQTSAWVATFSSIIPLLAVFIYLEPSKKLKWVSSKLSPYIPRRRKGKLPKAIVKKS